MKSLGLLSTLTFSQIRSDILFYLRNGSKTLGEIKEYMKISLSPAILPRVKELKEDDMIEQDEDGNYSITLLGDVAAHHYKPFLDVIETIEGNKEFWTSHDLSAIPTELRYRLGELKGCKVLTRTGAIFESQTKFIESVIDSYSFKGVTCVLFPEWITLFSELASQKFPVEIIVTNEIFETIKREYALPLAEWLKNPNAHIYTCDENLKVAAAAMDGTDGLSLSLSLFTKKGYYDLKQDLMGTTPESFKWGEDLFEYYKENSVEMFNPEIEQIACPMHQTELV